MSPCTGAQKFTIGPVFVLPVQVYHKYDTAHKFLNRKCGPRANMCTCESRLPCPGQPAGFQ